MRSTKKGFEDVVVKDEVDSEVINTYGNSFLAGDEAEAAVEVEEEVRQLVDETGLQFGEEVSGLLDDMTVHNCCRQ